LELVGLLAETTKAKPGRLSGGQRQRVAIARAIVVPPRLILCDEPTSSLDVSLAATVLNLLSDLRQELGMAMIFVTHDLAVARFVGDRIAVMYLGRIVEDGPVEIVAANAAPPYTQALFAAAPGNEVQSKLEGELAGSTNLPGGCAFEARCPIAIATCRSVDPGLVALDPLARHRAACIRLSGCP
jgi:peptide/nickel transport system ATP-binding protein